MKFKEFSISLFNNQAKLGCKCFVFILKESL